MIKKEYVINIKKIIHRLVNQTALRKSYTDMNSDLVKIAKSDLENAFSSYKTIQFLEKL